MEYTYTFIIPHHNSPELLNRCINSIPQRDDIQIIVVDDNSVLEKRANVDRHDVKTIFIDADHTKGAGHARNVGLAEAEGKWLLFADADDFYNTGFIDVLDRYKELDIDMLFFSCNSVDSDTLRPDHDRGKRIHTLIEMAINGQSDALDQLKYCYRSPWYKMIRHDLVKRYSIAFEEVKRGNDVMFSFDTCYHCRKYEITSEQLYCVTYQKGSITFSKKTFEDYYTIISGLIKKNAFYKAIGLNKYIISFSSFLLHGYDTPIANTNIYNKIKSHTFFTLKSIACIFTNFMRLFRERNKYVKTILNK